jgi:hypothetical protein
MVFAKHLQTVFVSLYLTKEFIITFLVVIVYNNTIWGKNARERIH